MIRKKDCCGCGDWKSMLKELWMKYQDVVKGVKAGGTTAYPDGDGIADVTDAVAAEVTQQISVALDDYVTDDELSAAIQYFVTQADVDSSISTALTDYQEKLISGTNIKTVNGSSLLGSGNITIQGITPMWGQIAGTLSDQTDLKNALDAKAPTNNPTFTGRTTLYDVDMLSNVTINDFRVSANRHKTLQESGNILVTTGRYGWIGWRTYDEIISDLGINGKQASLNYTDHTTYFSIEV